MGLIANAGGSSISTTESSTSDIEACGGGEAADVRFGMRSSGGGEVGEEMFNSLSSVETSISVVTTIALAGEEPGVWAVSSGES